MTGQEYIEQKIAQYNEAFEIYIESGSMPDTIPDDDLLSLYMKSVIEDNPQLDTSDKKWVEVLKGNLMEFIEAMLGAFMPAEQVYYREASMISTFCEADISMKRMIWNEVYNDIKHNYTPAQVNVDAYIKQFATQDRDDVFASLIHDWQQANEEKKKETERTILENNTKRFENQVKEWGRSDYEALIKVEKLYYKYPALDEIVRIMGREQQENKEEKDDIIYKYIPILPSEHPSHTDVEQITPDNDLNHLIPSETAILSDTDTEILFYQKFASHQLQTFSNKPLHKGQVKDVQHNNSQNRLTEGPMIVAIDTSGSMYGMPKKVAYSILLELLRMAKKKHRKCYLLQFSVRATALDLTTSVSWKKLDRFLYNGYSGGTDGEEMLRKATDALQSENYSMADVLIISDFEFPNPSKSTKGKIRNEQEKGTRFYGLSIGGRKGYSALDRIWHVKL